jgi:hypothetical protein
VNPNPAFGEAPAGSNARDALNVPAVLLMVSGGIGVLLRLAGMVGGGSSRQMMDQLARDPNTARIAEMFSGPMNIVVNLIGVALSAFVIFGALKMRNLQGHGLALGAAIVSIIPCSGCCCIGLPVGIWALVLLLKPEVKSQFQG